LQELMKESPFRRTHRNLKSRYLNTDIEFADCPVEASLGVLGKKWTILIIRDIGVYGRDRFNKLLKSLPGIPSKMLATRLKELEKEGFLEKRVEKSTPPKIVWWSLTEKGLDAIRIGMMVGAFGSRWHADRVFVDRRPRTIRELYDREGLELLTKGF